ncbi:MAG: hypothetical protein ACI8XO_000009 [Verrucomicrobiales bacterium]|jgi:hypothetical protein
MPSTISSKTSHMRKLISTLLASASCCVALAQDEAVFPRSEYELVDSLEQNNLQEAIRILLKSYIKRDNLDSLELNRAAMHGLLDRSGFGVTLIDRKAEDDAAAQSHQLVAESLTKTVAYLRPGTFSVGEFSKIGKKLDEFSKSGVESLILDLRVPAKAATFQDAARFLNHFCPPSELLFKLQKPGEQRPSLFLSKPATAWEGGLILLIDQQTSPAGEAIAEVLRRQRAPIIIGTATPGKTVEYEKVIIAEEAYLRFAVAELIFADGSSIFRKGVQPDLDSSFEVADKAYVFDASQTDGMRPFLYSKQQPRHNEAALVAGTNPELDYAIAKSAGRDTGYDTQPIHDRVVQAALDYLITAEIQGSNEG